MFKRTETILFIVLTIGVIILTLMQINETSFIYEIGEWVLYFAFGCAFIYALFRVIKVKRAVSLFDKFKPSILGILLIGFFFLLSYLVDTDGGKRRVITGGLAHEVSFLYFQFFDDNKFKILNSGFFGGTFYRGSYTLRNDTLTIDNVNLKDMFPSLTFVLRKNKDNQKYFEPLDSTASIYQLKIYKDFRTDK